MTDAGTTVEPAPAAHQHRRTALVALLLAAALAILARLVIAWHSIGTDDAFTFYGFAQGVEQLGLGWMYANVPLFNHPPLVGYWSMAAWQLTGGGDLHEFAFVFKLPMIAGDALAAWLLWRMGAMRSRPVLGAIAAAGYAWSPVAILVGTYHCNTDNLVAVLCLLAVYLMDAADARGRPGSPAGWRHGLGGLALGAAINIKLIPVLLIVPLTLSCRGTRATGWFMTGLAVALLPLLVALAVEPAGFYRNVLGYRSAPANWGLTFLLLETSAEPALNALASPLLLLLSALAPAIIFLLVLGLSLVNRSAGRWTRAQIGAISLGLFLVLTPGFGMQYLVVLVPLLFAADVRFAFIYSAVGGLFLGLTYWSYLVGGRPYVSLFEGPLPLVVLLIGLITWTLLAQWTVRRILRPSGFDGRGPGA